jgi:hypothetical protein
MRMKAILVLAGTAAFVVSPFLTQGFGGFAPDLFPIPQDRPPVQPTGYAFAIWGLIYLWLVVHAGTGLFARAEDADWDRTRWPLIVSLAVGASWIAVANTSAVWATVLIWVMLGGALAARWLAPAGDRWLAAVPLGIYAGWLTAASWVAIGLMLGGYGVLSEVWAAVAALLGAVVMAVTMQTALGQAPEYGLTVIWALFAVVVANVPGAPVLAAFAALGIALVAVALLRQLRRS